MAKNVGRAVLGRACEGYTERKTIIYDLFPKTYGHPSCSVPEMGSSGCIPLRLRSTEKMSGPAPLRSRLRSTAGNRLSATLILVLLSFVVGDGPIRNRLVNTSMSLVLFFALDKKATTNVSK
jgi:hypothetical protein